MTTIIMFRSSWVPSFFGRKDDPLYHSVLSSRRHQNKDKKTVRRTKERKKYLYPVTVENEMELGK